MKWLCLVTAFVAGVAAGLAFTLTENYTFSFEVNVVNILQLTISLLQVVVTFLIALLFQHIFKKRAEIRTAEKDLVTGQIQVAQDALNQVRKRFTSRYQAKGKTKETKEL